MSSLESDKVPCPFYTDITCEYPCLLLQETTRLARTASITRIHRPAWQLLEEAGMADLCLRQNAISTEPKPPIKQAPKPPSPS